MQRSSTTADEHCLGCGGQCVLVSASPTQCTTPLVCAGTTRTCRSRRSAWRWTPRAATRASHTLCPLPSASSGFCGGRLIGGRGLGSRQGRWALHLLQLPASVGWMSRQGVFVAPVECGYALSVVCSPSIASTNLRSASPQVCGRHQQAQDCDGHRLGGGHTPPAGGQLMEWLVWAVKLRMGLSWL